MGWRWGFRRGSEEWKEEVEEEMVSSGVSDSAAMVTRRAKVEGVERKEEKVPWRSLDAVMPDCMVEVQWKKGIAA